MKVKVNGAWVDVPAFKVVEKSGANVIEGEVTLTSNSAKLVIEHNQGKIPKLVGVMLSTTATSNRSFAFMLMPNALADARHIATYSGGSFTGYAPAKVDSDAVTYNQYYYNDNMIAVGSGTSGRLWVAGTYKYTLIFDE